MRTPTLQSLLLILVLVFGQWASLAHADKHTALSPAADQTCEFCVHAQGLGAGLAAVPKAATPDFAHEAHFAAVPCSAELAAPSYYSARGPPAHFA